MPRRERIIISILLIWALSASFLTITLFYEVSRLRSIYKGEVITVDVGINYGNSTIVWYNDTRILAGSSAYQALLIVAENVNASVGAMGVFVHGINSVNEYDSVYWFYAVYNKTVQSIWVKVDNWIYPGVSCNNLILDDGDIVVWIFFNYAKYANNFPIPTTTDYVR